MTANVKHQQFEPASKERLCLWFWLPKVARVIDSELREYLRIAIASTDAIDMADSLEVISRAINSRHDIEQRAKRGSRQENMQESL